MDCTRGGCTGFQNCFVKKRCYAFLVVEDVMSNLEGLMVSDRIGHVLWR
jgi:hypothetical protein